MIPLPLHNVTCVTKRYISFEVGNCDESLFYLAKYLVKSGMPVVTIEKYLTFIAQRCKPPFPEEEMSLKIQSALKRSKSRERSLSQEKKDPLSVTEALQTSRERYRALQKIKKATGE